MTLNRMQESQETGLARSAWIAIVAVVGISAFFIIRSLGTSLRESALEELRNEDFAAAKDSFDRMIQADPKDMEARYYRGYCEQRRRNSQKALADYVKVRSDSTWGEQALYRTIETYLDDERSKDAESEIESAMGDRFDQSTLAQEIAARFHMWKCNQNLTRATQLLAPIIGDGPAVRYGNYARRVVLADSKIYAASLDKMLARLQREHAFKKIAVLTNIIERAHEHLVTANIAFLKACSNFEADPTQSAPVLSHILLADIYEVRRRQSDFEVHLRAVLETQKSQLLGEVTRETLLPVQQRRARLRLAESKLKLGAYEESIALILETKSDSKGHRPYVYERVLAEAHRGLGNDEKALEIANYWLNIQPKYPTVNFIKGASLFKNGDYDAAYPFLEVAVGKRYRGREFVPTYVSCLLKLGKFDRANSVLDKVIEARPRDWEAVLLKTQAMEGMGWIEDARAYLNKQLGSKFKVVGSEANKELRKFMEAFVARNDLLPKTLNTAQVLFEEDRNDFDIGRRYLDLLIDAGGVEKARSLAVDLFKRCPKQDAARFNVMMSTGRAFEHLRKNDLAIVSFKEAVRERPYAVSAHIGVARNEVIGGKIAEAARFLDHAAALDPELAELHRIRFDILLAENRQDAALKEAQIWIKKGGRDRATLHRVTELLLLQGQKEFAKATISMIEKLGVGTSEENVDLALLQLKAGMENKALERLDKSVTTFGFGVSHLIDLSKQLAEAGRNDLVIRFLAARVFEDKEIDSEAVSILAAAYRKTNDTENFLNLLARLRRRGRNYESFSWAAEFCNSHKAFPEILSIVDAAILESAATPEIIELGITTALKLGERKAAGQFNAELIKLPSVPPGMKNRMRALLQDADGNFLQSVEILQTTLAKVPAQYRTAVWTQLIEMLAEKKQFEFMKKSVSIAVAKQEVPAGYSAHVARLLVAAADPSAKEAVLAATQVAPDAANAWYDRGVVALAEGDYKEALKHIKKSWDLRPEKLPTYALAVISAATDHRGMLNRVLRKKSGRYPPYVSSETPIMANMLRALLSGNISGAKKLASTLRFPSTAERDALLILISTPTKTTGERREFVSQLARFFVFAGEKHTLRYAAAAAKQIEEILPNRNREISLLRARALMGSPATYLKGISIVKDILDSSNMTDEAGLSIYAQGYLQTKDYGDLETLVKFILKRPGFSDSFKMDLARSLSQDGLYEQAAFLLHTCQQESFALARQEARALFKSGHKDRAAELIRSRVPKKKRAFDYSQIVGTFMLERNPNSQEGYELLKQAVYRYQAVDDEVQLTFAKYAYHRGANAEARKNVTAYLDRQPASAKRVSRALQMIQTLDQPDATFLGKLEDRRFLLDPRGYLERP